MSLLALLVLLNGACASAPAVSGALTDCAPREGGSAPLTATYFGVSTIGFSDGRNAIMTDGFFSRPGFWRVLASRVAPDPVRIDAALERGGIDRLDAVFVAHSHYDHVLDAPVVAARTCARIVGSASTANVARGQHLPEERIDIIADGQERDFGAFQIRAIRTPHSEPQALMGEISEPLPVPARATRFTEGGSYSFLIRHRADPAPANPDRADPDRSILVIPSANFTGEAFRGVRADIVFMGVGGAGRNPAFLRRYWDVAVQGTCARIVIPIHWDNFTHPLDEGLAPMRLVDNFARTRRTLNELAARDGVTLIIPEAYQRFQIDALLNRGATQPRRNCP
jgi:L-ascorbate metabolism protein UlaG (beta-lactamase superfamily)